MSVSAVYEDVRYGQIEAPVSAQRNQALLLKNWIVATAMIAVKLTAPKTAGVRVAGTPEKAIEDSSDGNRGHVS